MAANDGAKRLIALGCAPSETLLRKTTPTESSAGVLNSTVYAPGEMPPTMKVPLKSVEPSNGVPRNVTRASDTSAPVDESRTVPVTVNGNTPLPDALLGTVATNGAAVGSAIRTMLKGSDIVRCTRMASFGSRHTATSTRESRGTLRHSKISPSEPVMPLSRKTFQRPCSSILARQCAPTSTAPLVLTARAITHAFLAAGPLGPHCGPKY